MSMLASTSTACYSCVLAKAASNSLKVSIKTKTTAVRFYSTSESEPRSNKKTWSKDVVAPHPYTIRKSLMDELRRLRTEDGVKIDNSVFATDRKILREGPAPLLGEPATRPHWRLHREALKEKFPEGWNPPRRVERSDMNTIRRLYTLDPIQFSTPNLADKFKISAEAVRRILKSKFRTDGEVEEAKIGDELLKEAELGSYDQTEPRSKFTSKRMMGTASEENNRRNGSSSSSPRSKYPERTSIPAKPLQDGFDPLRMSKNYKWAAGRQSNYANGKQEREDSERTYKRQWESERLMGSQDRPRWRAQ